MEPTNDHERAIAQAVDEKFRIDPASSYESIVAGIARSLDFSMSVSDTKFLFHYSQVALALVGSCDQSDVLSVIKWHLMKI